MIVLQASHIQKQWNGADVLMDASVTVQQGDHVALVGANGAGKSTLLRILTGEMLADGGEVSIAKNCTLGYVAQFVEPNDDTITVYDYVASAFEEIRQLERHLRLLEHQMALPEIHSHEQRFAEISEAYMQMQHTFEQLGGYALDARIRRVLSGMRFPTEMQQLSVSQLSGGQKTRLSLARLLALEPHLLILDEPTNYLDTDTLTWLESYLQAYTGALLVVSHDRYFLDEIATVIIELEAGRTKRFIGNYSTYIEEKANAAEAEEKRYEAQQKEIARMEEFVQKNIVRASTTKRAQSRRKLLERMERLDRPSSQQAAMAVNFQSLRPSGKDVLRIENLQIGYDQKILASHLQLHVARGQRVAIVGPNGIGKTTLLKVLMGIQPPLQGKISFGQHVQIGYYHQEQEDLDAAKTVIDQLWDEHPHLDQTTIRTVLGRFLFRGEQVMKPVGALSGGEKSRLNLCRLMLAKVNTLLLDEPTNHLDLLSKEMLEDALQDYDGTILFISHDRYFIDAIATHVAFLTPNGFEVYIGNYSAYRRKKLEEEKWQNEGHFSSLHNEIASATPAQTKGTGSPNEITADVLPGNKRPRIRSSDLRKAEEKVEKLELNIAKNEERQQEISYLLNEAVQAQEIERTKQLQAELATLEEQHPLDWQAWEEAMHALETLVKQMNSMNSDSES